MWDFLEIHFPDKINNLQINKEVKITSVEGRFKTSDQVRDPFNLLQFGIYDNNYGLLCYVK